VQSHHPHDARSVGVVAYAVLCSRIRLLHAMAICPQFLNELVSHGFREGSAGVVRTVRGKGREEEIGNRDLRP